MKEWMAAFEEVGGLEQGLYGLAPCSTVGYSDGTIFVGGAFVESGYPGDIHTPWTIVGITACRFCGKPFMATASGACVTCGGPPLGWDVRRAVA